MMANVRLFVKWNFLASRNRIPWKILVSEIARGFLGVREVRVRIQVLAQNLFHRLFNTGNVG